MKVVGEDGDFSNVTGKNDKDDNEDGDFRCGGENNDGDSMCDGETNDDGVGEDSNDDDNDCG